MNFPVITDPWFYAAAVPAVLLMGISKSGFGSGFGALAVPLMALAIPVPEAAAILMPILFAIDVMGMAAFRGHFDWPLIRFIVPMGLVGTVIGALSFRYLDARTVAGIVGVFTLLFLAQRFLFPPKPDDRPSKWAGALLTITSGFASFIAHSGGPPVSAYVIPLRLAPLTFTATLSAYFFVINLSKWVPYAWLGLLDARNLATSMVLLPFAPMGVWVGLRLAHRIKPELFFRLVYTGMFLTGIKLVWDALR